MNKMLDNMEIFFSVIFFFFFSCHCLSQPLRKEAIEFNTSQYPINQICYIFPKYHFLPTVTKLLRNLAASSTVCKHLQ